MDHVGEAVIGLVGAHDDAFELLELAEEIFDEMPLDISSSMASRVVWDRLTRTAPTR
jgi:hypothetical protein